MQLINPNSLGIISNFACFRDDKLLSCVRGSGGGGSPITIKCDDSSSLYSSLVMDNTNVLLPYGALEKYSCSSLKNLRIKLLTKCSRRVH